MASKPPKTIMPITGPNRDDKDKANYSEFIYCEGFAFKLNQVESFYHEPTDERDGVTIVNLRSFKQEIADPKRKLFDFLMKRFHPITPDEAC